ncbi:MAG: ABC transporter permease subunit [Planctomycetota bacterium]
MDSNGLTLTFSTRMMPFWAILRHDLRSLLGSWLVRLWLGGTVLLTLLLTMSNWAHFQTAPLIASLLFPYLVFPWFLVVMVLGVSPVSGSRAEALADGILSRPITRYEYLLATWSARVAVVVVPYLIVTIAFICLLSAVERPMVPEDTVTLYGITAALGVVGLVLVFQVSLAFLVGTLLRTPLFALVVLLVLWYPVNGMLNAFRLEEFSPIALNQAIPTLLRQPWQEVEGDSPSEASSEEIEALSRQAQNFLSGLGGGQPQRPVQSEPNFFDGKDFEDFSLTRVVLGYGIPTVLSISLAMLCFCIRDL